MPFRHRLINEIFKLRKLKHGSKYKKMVENPNYEKILKLLIAGKGKWVRLSIFAQLGNRRPSFYMPF